MRTDSIVTVDMIFVLLRVGKRLWTERTLKRALACVASHVAGQGVVAGNTLSTVFTLKRSFLRVVSFHVGVQDILSCKLDVALRTSKLCFGVDRVCVSCKRMSAFEYFFAQGANKQFHCALKSSLINVILETNCLRQ